jgi:hypothetical protein
METKYSDYLNKNNKLIYEVGKHYNINISKKDLIALKKQFNFKKGQVGTLSSGFELSNDKTSIWGFEQFRK